VEQLDNGEIDAITTSIEQLNSEQRQIQAIENAIERLSHEKQLLAQNYASLTMDMEVLSTDSVELNRILQETHNSNTRRAREISQYLPAMMI